MAVTGATVGFKIEFVVCSVGAGYLAFATNKGVILDIRGLLNI